MFVEIRLRRGRRLRGIESMDGGGKKRRGELPFRDLAPYSPIYRRPGSVRVTADCHFRIVRVLRAEPALPIPYPLSQTRCKSFPGFHPLAPGFPAAYASLVSDSLFRFFPRPPCEVRFQFPWGSFPGSLAGSASSSRSSFPGSLASAASGSPEVPFPALLRGPLPVLRWLLSALF